MRLTLIVVKVVVNRLIKHQTIRQRHTVVDGVASYVVVRGHAGARLWEAHVW